MSDPATTITTSPPSPPPPPPPGRLPSGDGYRNREFRVFETLTAFGEKTLGTAAYGMVFLAGLIAGAFQAMIRLLKKFFVWLTKLAEIPARAMHLFTWNDHLLSPSARTTIMSWGWLILLIGVWDTFVWSKTFDYVFVLQRDVCIASCVMGLLTIFVERSFVTMDSDPPLVRTKSILKRMLKGYFLISCIRLLVLLMISLSNGEAMRVQLARDEIENAIDLQEATINRQLHERRAAEIEAEIERRRNEAATQANNDRLALTQRRQAERTQIVQERSRSAAQQRADVREQDALAERERNAPHREGVGPLVRDIRARQQAADENLQEFEQGTVEVLSRHDHETAEAQTRLSDQVATRTAALDAERDRRIEQLHRMTMAELGAQYGIHTTRARGLWARRDVLVTTVHHNSPSSKAVDWFTMVLLTGIGFLPFLSKKMASSAVANYYSVQAHAFADDGTPEYLRAKEIYHQTLLNDPDVQDLKTEYLKERAKLEAAYRAFLEKLADTAAQRDVTGLALPFTVVSRMIRQAWVDTKVDEVKRVIAQLELSASWPRIPLPAHPSSETAYLAQFPELDSHQLVALGWEDPRPELDRRQGLVAQYESIQEDLMAALNRHYEKFGRTFDELRRNEISADYYGLIRPYTLELARCAYDLSQAQLQLPRWVYGVDPRQEAVEIERHLFARRSPPMPPPPPPRNSDSDLRDEDVVPVLDADQHTVTTHGNPPALRVMQGGASNPIS